MGREWISRDECRAVLAQLREVGGPPVLILRTDRLTVPAMADQVRAALEERRHAR